MKQVTSTDREIVERSVSQLVDWLQRSPWESYDPYDYKGKPEMASIVKRPTTSRMVHIMGLLFPRLMRRLLGVQPTGTASGYAYLVSGFSQLASMTEGEIHRDLAARALRRLLSCRIPGGGWGLPFDWQTSTLVRIPKHTTLSYSTYTGLRALLDYYHCLGEHSVLVLAGDIARSTLNHLNHLDHDNGAVLSYSIYDRYEVINTNALLGAVFCEAGALLAETELLALGQRMLAFVLGEQNSDGSWNYFSKRTSDSARIDNYHMAMTMRGVVESLDHLGAGEADQEKAIEDGLGYYETTFLCQSVFPALWPQKPYPKDIACVSEGALLYAALLRQGQMQDPLETKLLPLLAWGIRNMQKPDGHFLYRKYRVLEVDLKSVRWGQGMMLIALSSALAQLQPQT